MRLRTVMLGAAGAIVARSLLIRLLVLKFGRDVEKLNAGDHSSLLAAYGDDFVLHFNEGDHRWSGDWVGKAGMDRFLQNFTRARIQGSIRSVAISGPLWALTLWVRFDDFVDAPDGPRIYENQTVLVLRTRFGKVVEQHDFYVDTGRILELDRRLSELGVEPIGKTP
jgi:ketosteroid isomerase-like protein